MTTGERPARRIVKERCAGKCEGCGGQLDQGLGHSWAHRRPRGLGGAWAPSNGLALCGTGTTGCHGWSTSHPEASEAIGWRITNTFLASSRVPAFIHTTNYLLAWVLLDDEGCVAWVDLPTPTWPDLPTSGSSVQAPFRPNEGTLL